MRGRGVTNGEVGIRRQPDTGQGPRLMSIDHALDHVAWRHYAWDMREQVINLNRVLRGHYH